MADYIEYLPQAVMAATYIAIKSRYYFKENGTKGTPKNPPH